MRLKTPDFWYNDTPFSNKLKSWVLLPAGTVYLAGHFLHHKIKKPYHPKTNVICVGNLVSGGSGKTPVCLSLMQIVKDKILAKSPCFLSRGYGGNIKKSTFLDHHDHDYTLVGDEPLLLAKHGPTIVSPHRRNGVIMAEQQGHDLIIMDDGFQNPGIKKTLSFIVIDGASGFGNGLPLPAGPLREPVSSGIERADAVIMLGEDRHNIANCLPHEMAVFRGKTEVDEEWLAAQDSTYIAFAGIGRPEKFRDTILEQGLKLTGWHAFPDHYPYKASDMAKIDKEASQKQARILTTEKDAVRVPADFSFQNKLDIMPVHVTWEDPEGIAAFLESRIKDDT